MLNLNGYQGLITQDKGLRGPLISRGAEEQSRTLIYLPDHDSFSLK